MSSTKSKVVLLWVLIVAAVSITVFIYLIKEDKPASRPIMGLSYFLDEQEAADIVLKIMAPEIEKNKSYLIGVEPEKNEHLDVASQMIKKLQSQHRIAKIIVDQELGLKSGRLKQLAFTDVVPVKENLYALGEKLQEFEKKGVSYILVSASIYTNSISEKNPFDILKEKYKLNPLTISFAYFPVNAQDEKNMIFPCRTEDQTGTAEWGCTIVNRARFARRKIIPDNHKDWVGLMDLSDEKNYILLLKRNDK